MKSVSEKSEQIKIDTIMQEASNEKEFTNEDLVVFTDIKP